MSRISQALEQHPGGDCGDWCGEDGDPAEEDVEHVEVTEPSAPRDRPEQQDHHRPDVQVRLDRRLLSNSRPCKCDRQESSGAKVGGGYRLAPRIIEWGNVWRQP